MDDLEHSDRSSAALTHDEVTRAAATLVAAFAATDTQAYFACFAPETEFVFHSEAQRLPDRASYERLWQSWLRAGWRVTACESSNARVHLLGDAAVFVHDVRTTTQTDGETDTTFERETIVFARAADGGVVAVHEHLSAQPSHGGDDS